MGKHSPNLAAFSMMQGPPRFRSLDHLISHPGGASSIEAKTAEGSRQRRSLSYMAVGLVCFVFVL